MKKKLKITILGGGSWGTVLANIAAENGSDVSLWLRDQALSYEINKHHRNSKYVPSLELSENLTSTTLMSEALDETNLIIICVPSSSFRLVLNEAKKFISKDAFLISATKGIEGKGFKLMSQIMEEELGSKNFIGVLSGPNLALEISLGHLSGTVIASKHKELKQLTSRVFNTSSFRVYTSDDYFGVELGGALKNIYALACGIADGLGGGENTEGMIITRGLAEMSRFAVALGADPMTFLGLSGVGDLITTCASPLSRNHAVGKYIGEGKTLDEALRLIGQTAEGLKTLKLVRIKSIELELKMPIVDSLYRIIFENEPLDGSVEKLLGKDELKDVEFSTNLKS